MESPDLVDTSGIIEDASLLQCNTDMTTPTTTVPSGSVFVGESNPSSNNNNTNGLVPTVSTTQTTTVTDAAKVAASRLRDCPR